MSRRPADVASKEKNEYIPSFITKKPFYVPDDESAPTTDYLEHQRLQSSAAGDAQSKWYDRGKKLGPAATKFRKGACENCGALTHKTKDCLSRPRAKGARWTGKDIQADEAVQEVKLSWDAKRDRWNGYDASEYRQVVADYNELEQWKKKARGDEAPAEKAEGKAPGEGPEEEAKYAEESEMGRQQSTATRNLRLREDTAKYLLNLDLDSAKYDPKTRSMVDAGAQLDDAAARVAEDNFLRASGDAAEFEHAQRAAWASQQRGAGADRLHLQANPTAGEAIRRKEAAEAGARREERARALRERYGEQAAPAPALRDAAVTESERYVEYDESGAVKGAPKVVARSKYAEDVFVNNHTAVWGSWWRNFEWGYACCHSTVKNSYCTGEEGKLAFEEAEKQRLGQNLPEGGQEEDEAVNEERPDESHGRTPEEAQKEPPKTSKASSKKRTVAEMQQGVTEEELEAYKRAKAQADDPMAKFIGKNELVH